MAKSTEPSDCGRWNPEFSITEPDVFLAAKNGTLTSARIIKNGQDFYVLIQLNWRKGQELFMSTTRSKKAPRRFRNIGRLVEYIEQHFLGITTVTLELAH